jgi:hypothetical protein
LKREVRKIAAALCLILANSANLICEDLLFQASYICRLVNQSKEEELPCEVLFCEVKTIFVAYMESVICNNQPEITGQ